MARKVQKQQTPKAYPAHEASRNAYKKDSGGLDGISGSGEHFDGSAGSEQGFYGGGRGASGASDYHSNFDGSGKSLNQRGMNLEPSKFRKDFNGRTDYKDRPTKSAERVPELGDRGIPPGITSLDGSRMRGPVQDIAGGESRGIPPMKADPQGIGMTIKGVTTKDPHV